MLWTRKLPGEEQCEGFCFEIADSQIILLIIPSSYFCSHTRLLRGDRLCVFLSMANC